MSAKPKPAAPTGRNKIAQGQERSDDALGHESQNTSRPEVAEESGGLPAGWRWMRADEVGVVHLGRQRSPKNRSAEFPTKYLRAANITENGINLSDVLEMDFKPSERERYQLQPGDIVLSEASGSPSQVGKPAVWKGELPLCCFQNTVIRLRPREADSKYLLWLFTHFYRNGIFAQVAGGVGINHLSAAKFSRLALPIAPPDEQHRIVAEIEKQFTRLEAGVAALQRVQANLKRYRAAVLKAACEGRLVPTEAELQKSEGRGQKSKAGYETGEALLARILTERRQNWQGRGKYKEPAAPDTTNLPSLPESWTWVSWEMVLAHEDGAFKRGPFGSALTKAIFVEKGFKVYEQYCPINDDCSFARYYITPEKFEELQAFEVKAGDYLISCSGVTLGRITRVPEQFERGIINQALLRVRINESVINHRYFLHLFRSALFQKAIFDNSTGSAIPNVKGVKELKAMAIPLPPLAEQTRIVAEVERRLSVVEELESVVSANLQRATRLRQSILQRAFSGKL